MRKIVNSIQSSSSDEWSPRTQTQCFNDTFNCRREEPETWWILIIKYCLKETKNVTKLYRLRGKDNKLLASWANDLAVDGEYFLDADEQNFELPHWPIFWLNKKKIWFSSSTDSQGSRTTHLRRPVNRKSIEFISYLSLRVHLNTMWIEMGSVNLPAFF